MAGTRSKTRAHALGWWLALVPGAGCHLAPAKVWNLEQVHTPEGTPKRRGRLHSDLGYFMAQLAQRTNFGGPEYRAREAAEERIDDPLGECLENVVELGDCTRDERVAALQVESFAWLAVDCSYVLSRERCVLELGELARVLDLEAAAELPSGEALGPEAAKTAFDELIAVTREVLAAPDLAGDALSVACARVQALPLDRPGTIRFLRGTSALLERGERGALLAPLRALRLELARRATRLALREALEDGHGRVRAAALEASLGAFPDERPGLLQRAIADPMPGVEARTDVSLRALELLARYGLPPPPDGVDPDVYEHNWCELLVQVLRLQVDGPHNISACRALGRITGEPGTLRPEVWMARWRAPSPAAGAEP